MFARFPVEPRDVRIFVEWQVGAGIAYRTGNAVINGDGMFIQIDADHGSDADDDGKGETAACKEDAASRFSRGETPTDEQNQHDKDKGQRRGGDPPVDEENGQVRRNEKEPDGEQRQENFQAAEQKGLCDVLHGFKVFHDMPPDGRGGFCFPLPSIILYTVYGPYAMHGGGKFRSCPENGRKISFLSAKMSVGNEKMVLDGEVSRSRKKTAEMVSAVNDFIKIRRARRSAPCGYI